ncbi:MAG TPA: SDR family oxidoreductase [Phycisphaerales bacterium]|nr:SDR family oxidoreductase [Phycisphaerales bacterium]
MSTLQGRIAVVTGASAGIGLAVAQELSSQGSRVVINARRAEVLRTAADAINSSAGASAEKPVCVPVAGDASEQGVIDQMLNTARRSFGAEADLVVINAGRGLSGSVLTSDTTQWDEMVRTNILGAAALMRSAARRLTSLVPEGEGGQTGGWLRRSGRDMIVIGSVVGRNVSPYSSMYGGTKFALHGMVEGVRRELAPKGVRVSLVEPGFVVSEFQGVAGYDPEWFKGVMDRIGPALDPADVARAIAFIASQPPHVHVADILVRPTRQDYP